jgi:hypothetical protein
MTRTAKDKWKAAFGKLRSIANEERSGKISAVLMGQSVTVYSRYYRTAWRLHGLESDAARRANHITEAARLTAKSPSWDYRMTHWNKARARTHILLARENQPAAFPALEAA